MAEPEDVIAEGALHATRFVRELWARHSAGQGEATPRLRDFKRRLELFVGAVFPEAPEIGLAEPPAPPSWLARLARRDTAHLHADEALSSSNEERIFLPAELRNLPSAAILDRYRLLALEQAARVERGSHRLIPEGALLRDLYYLSEAAAVDLLLVRTLPRLASAFSEARLEAFSHWPMPRRPSPRERAVAQLLADLVGAHPARPPSPFIAAATPADSLAWARVQWRSLTSLAGPYRGMAPMSLWGVAAPPGVASTKAGQDEVLSPPAGRTRTLPRRPGVRDASDEEDDAESGTWMVRADDLQEKAEDPAGLMRPADRDQEADPGELADALSELPELRLVRTPGPVSEILAGEEPIARASVVPTGVTAEGLAYPEWDWRAAAYRPRAAVVREGVAVSGP
ncbi:MAG TPA: hypothetical protein VLD58_05420, partial [Gemmatimonadales bacterium]|nr:hypothetical protein [Gemmatimonadales bacterium]